MELYDPELLERPRMIVANKMDESNAEANLKKFKRKVRKVTMIPISGAYGDGLPVLLKAMRKSVEDATGPLTAGRP